MERLFIDGINEKVKTSRGIATGPHKGACSVPYKPAVAMANVLTHVVLWPTSIKLNSSCKTCLDKTLLYLIHVS